MTSHRAVGKRGGKSNQVQWLLLNEKRDLREGESTNPEITGVEGEKGVSYRRDAKRISCDLSPHSKEKPFRKVRLGISNLGEGGPSPKKRKLGAKLKGAP